MQPRAARTHRPAAAALAFAAATALFLTSCTNAGSAGDANTVAMIPNYQGGGASTQPQPMGYTTPANTVTVTLG